MEEERGCILCIYHDFPWNRSTFTTHGEYSEEKLAKFLSPTENIRKINAAPIGSCADLNQNWAHSIKSGISSIMTQRTNMNTKSNTVIDMLKALDRKLYKNEKE